MGYLVADGVNDYCTIPNTLTGNAGTDAYTLEFSAAFPTTPASNMFLIGVASGTTSNGFQITTNGRFQVVTAGSNRYFTAPSFILFDSTIRTYRLEHDAGGAWRAYRDGTLFGSGTFSVSTAFAALGLFFRIHPTSTGYIACNLEYLETTGLGNSARWEANLSGGTGSTLPTVGGTNNATLINFPTDNSQWQGFGSTITATVAATMPQMTIASSGSAAAPQFDSAVAFSMPQMTASAIADNIAPSIATVAFAMPQMTASASAVVIPEQVTTVSFTMPQMTVAATATNPTPTWQGSVAFTMPQMAVTSSAEVAAPGNAATIGFAMPQMQASAAAQVTQPVYLASVTISMPQMTVHVLTGGLVYYSGDGSHIEQAQQSRHIEQVAESRQLAYSNQNRHIEWRV